MLTNGVNEIINDLDGDFLDNLIEDLNSYIAGIERYLMDYQQFFGNTEQMNSVLDAINAINLICQQTFLEPLHAYIQVLVDFFYEVCSGRFGKSHFLSELMLLLVDEVRASFDDISIRRTLDIHLLDELRSQIKDVMRYTGNDYEGVIKSVISAFSSRIHPDLVFTAFEKNGTKLFIDEQHHQEEFEAISGGIKIFEDLAISLDTRSTFWKGRTPEILGNCLLINNYLSPKVDILQLTAAVYMHDVGMALLPGTFPFKDGKYTSIEVMLLQQHPIQIYELMRQMPEWIEAADIVHQHHEHFNGKGYPNELCGNDIHTGAKIIAIADAFYSMTHKRLDRGFTKSLPRAMTEINRFNGTQFDPKVLEAFNNALLDNVERQ